MEGMEKIRVMLADDNQSVLRLLTDFLSRKAEIDVVGAVSDGAAILDAVRESAPDVLVMDIIMPRKDGFMVLEELRSLDGALRPKVIVLTGLSRDDFIMRAISLGAGYYMVKPFDFMMLAQRRLGGGGREPARRGAQRQDDSEAGRQAQRRNAGRADRESLPDGRHSRAH